MLRIKVSNRFYEYIHFCYFFAEFVFEVKIQSEQKDPTMKYDFKCLYLFNNEKISIMLQILHKKNKLQLARKSLMMHEVQNEVKMHGFKVVKKDFTLKANTIKPDI